MKPTTTLAESATPDGARLTLQEHDGEYYLKVGGIQLMSTRAAASEARMAEIACENLGEKARVLIGGLGFGFTLRRVLEISNAQVEVAELLTEIVDWNREHLADVNGMLLDDERVELHEGDVCELLTGRGGKYDAIMLDVDNSPDALVQQGNGRLYRRQGLKWVRKSLRQGGRVVFWSAERDRGFERLLADVFPHVESLGEKAYPKAKKPTHTLFVADRD